MTFVSAVDNGEGIKTTVENSEYLAIIETALNKVAFDSPWASWLSRVGDAGNRWSVLLFHLRESQWILSVIFALLIHRLHWESIRALCIRAWTRAKFFDFRSFWDKPCGIPGSNIVEILAHQLISWGRSGWQRSNLKVCRNDSWSSLVLLPWFPS